MRLHVPLCLASDAYTIAGECMAAQSAIDKSVYNLTNRRSPKDAWPEVAKDSRMVLYGVEDFIENYLLKPVTHSDIDEAKEFLSTAHSFGGPLSFSEETWRRIVTEYNGYLPIRIEGLLEGSTFFPNEPVIQVTSLANGFGEIAAHIEATMLGMVSIATARATLTRHWLDRMRDWVLRSRKINGNVSTVDKKILDECDQVARWMIHDFGMRASSCPEESEILGRAHLLSFHGTDTFNAAYQAWKMGPKRPTGTSILALAHRIVQGHITEEQAYNQLFNTGTPIASYVADCYDFHKAVKNFLGKLAEQRKGIVVIRPDSGDWLENCLFIAYDAYERGLYELNKWGSKDLNYEKFIQGDSMNPFKINTVLESLESHGFNPVGCGIFGVGGWLRNSVTRDSLSSAYKLSACGQELRPVVKLSDTPAKHSIPGPNRIWHPILPKPSVFFSSEEGGSDYVTYYDAEVSETIREHYREGFNYIQHRAINGFDSFRNFPYDWGVNGEVLSPKVKEFRDSVAAQYNK